MLSDSPYRHLTIARLFFFSSVLQHVDQLLAACSQSLFALRTLRQHGLPADALHVVFQAIVANKLLYVSPAWWGSPLPMTVTAWRDVYVGQQNSVTVPHRRPSLVCAPMLTTSSLPNPPATLNIFYTICYLLYANNITLSVNALTITACQIVLKPSWIKTF